MVDQIDAPEATEAEEAPKPSLHKVTFHQTVREQLANAAGIDAKVKRLLKAGQGLTIWVPDEVLPEESVEGVFSLGRRRRRRDEDEADGSGG